MLAVIAWTVNGALGGSGNAQQAADTTHTGKHGHSGVAAAATTSPALAAGTADPTAAATATPQPTGQASAGHGAGAKSAAGTCPPGSVVLSLFTTKYRYLAHQAPRFQLDLVSTAARPCSFDVGAKHVQLVIKAGGERRVWDSADCVRSGGQRMQRLTRGVPAVLRISWDRKTSVPGCRLPGQAARPGTYTATARSGPLRSQSLIFVLAGRGIAVP